MARGKIIRELERIWMQMTNYFPYILIWYWKKWLKKTDGMIMFLRSPIHYVMFENMHAFLPEVRIVAGNKKTSDYLQSRGIEHTRDRLYPEVVILADYNQNRYPLRDIKKIQIYHGVGPKNYFYHKGDKEMFYLVPGYYAANKLKAQGKQRVAVVGYPKTDGFFAKRWCREEIYRKLGAKPERKTVLYTPTWGQASTAPILYEVINKIGERYNTIVKLHDHSPERWRTLYRGLPNVIYCEDADPTTYQFVADLLISDFSSTIFEYAQLIRPIVSVGVDQQRLQKNATDPRWWDITCKVGNPEELTTKVSELLESGWSPSDYYLLLVKEIFCYNDGDCARRAAQTIQRIARQTNWSRGFRMDIPAGD